MKKMNRSKWFSMAMALSASVVVSVSAAQAQTWTQWIDFGDPGYAETGETWRSNDYPFAHNGTYRYQSRWSDVGKNIWRYGTATFTADPLPYTGIYEVAITYRSSENRTPRAEFVVTKDKKGNLLSETISQLGDGSIVTHVFGQFEYKQGQRPYLKLVDNDNESDSDAVDAAYFKLITVLPDATTGPAVNQLLLDDKKPK